MRKLIYVLSALFLMSGIGCSQTGNKKSSEISFKDGQEFDFGKIKFDSQGSNDFVFKNTRKAPLIITNVKTSCGCTVPTYPKEPVGVKAESAIKVKYDTKRVGKFSKTITVFSNAKNSPVTLKIKGEVLPQEIDNNNE